MMPLRERFRRIFGPSERQRWVNGQAAAIADKHVDSQQFPEVWNLHFVRAKQAITEFHSEYGARP